MSAYYISPGYTRLSSFIDGEVVKFVSQQTGHDVDSKEYTIHLGTDETPASNGSDLYYDSFIQSFFIPDWVLFLDTPLNMVNWRFFMIRADGTREALRRVKIDPVAAG